MSQNDYDVTTNAIVSNNLAFIYILFFFGFLVTYFAFTSQKHLRRKILHSCQKANTPEQKNEKLTKTHLWKSITKKILRQERPN